MKYNRIAAKLAVSSISLPEKILSSNCIWNILYEENVSCISFSVKIEITLYCQRKCVTSNTSSDFHEFLKTLQHFAAFQKSGYDGDKASQSD